MQDLTEIAPQRVTNKFQTSISTTTNTTQSLSYLIVKRAFDIVSSFVALIILTPILIPIMIGLKLTGEGYIFYFQKRIGYKKKYFDIWKFATMLKNSPNMLTGSLTVRHDPRITPMGGFLRKTKINELPQLVNVLIGDMSIVGPRPQMQVDFDVYPEHVKESICNAKPGITGIGSIIFRDEEAFLSVEGINPKIFYAEKIAPYKGEVEIWYQKNQSTITDLAIIFLTAWVIIFPSSDLVYKIFKDLPKRTF
jgi:lipopolysaccharide/colanic/teichoic acid biosynthesis glycosyltransferase